ncbi:hypothetical protein [Mycoplasmopsis canis]|uniref:hypothetical protein n=1 Tax=Mycoplasmopsis canis TaxID=29555 RepID=UPI00101E1760|nr:hypothetical protein [Mycoplasmopsis canis]
MLKEIKIVRFKKIKYQNGEANLDFELKEIIIDELKNSFIDFKNWLLKEKNVFYKKLFTDNPIILKFLEFKINNNKMKEKNDITIEINYNNQIFVKEIEIKTRKDSFTMFGSSISKIKNDLWLIFILRKNNFIDICIGLYIDALTNTTTFPDRQIRPIISFKNLKEKSKINYEELVKGNNFMISKNNTSCFSCDSYFKNILINEWSDILINKKKNEKWFYTYIRFFLLNFLLKYENWNKDQKLIFKNYLRRTIGEIKDENKN